MLTIRPGLTEDDRQHKDEGHLQALTDSNRPTTTKPHNNNNKMKRKEFKGLNLISYDVDNVEGLSSLAMRISETKSKTREQGLLKPQVDTSNVLDDEMRNEIMIQNRSGIKGSLPVVHQRVKSRNRRVDALMTDTVIADIPMSKQFKEANLVEQPPEMLEKCFRDEYASKYLERLNISVTPKNVRIVNNVLPITQCIAHKHRNHNNDLYLSFTHLQGLANPLGLSRVENIGYDHGNSEMANLNFDLVTNPKPTVEKVEEDEEDDKHETKIHTGDVFSADGKLTVPKFEEYKKYIYPYNILREKFMLDGDQTELDKSIFEIRQSDKRRAKKPQTSKEDVQRSKSRTDTRVSTVNNAERRSRFGELLIINTVTFVKVGLF